MTGYEYEYEWDQNYCYPNSFILKNKLDIHDAQILNEAERRLTSLNILQIKEEPVVGSFDLLHLQEIHKAIFSDIFTWAGELRSVDIAKGNQFCLCQHLMTYANNLFRELKEEQYLRHTIWEDIPKRLAYYLSEINVLHPFREGNGRTQRVFIEYLAQNAGYYVDFSEVSSREMIEASALSFSCQYEMMEEMFKRILSEMPKSEHHIFCKKLNNV